MKKTLLLLCLVLSIAPVLAQETPFWLPPYGPGYEYKNGSWVDDFTSIDHNVTNGMGAYFNGSTATWSPNGWINLTYPSGSSWMYKNSTMGSGRYIFKWTKSTVFAYNFFLLADQTASFNETYYNISGNKYVIFTQAGALSSVQIHRIAGGADTTLLTKNYGAGVSTNTWYVADIFFNATSPIFTINFTSSVVPNFNASVYDTTFSSGYFGFTSSPGFMAESTLYDNLSVEMAPGAGNPQQNGVNWTNQSGYPVDGIICGAVVVLNDTTTRRHFTNPFHTTLYGGTFASNVSCDPGVPECPHYTDGNTWSISNATWSQLYFTENISFVTDSMMGYYDVEEKVTNTFGMNVTKKLNYLHILSPAPLPQFFGTPLSGTAPLLVQFNDTTTSPGILFWNWSFGDTSWFNTSLANARNATHTYSVPGTYSVMLSVTNTSGSNSTARTDYISVTSSPVITPVPPAVTPRSYIRIGGGNRPTRPTPTITPIPVVPEERATPSLSLPEREVREIPFVTAGTRLPGFEAHMAVMSILALICCRKRFL